jgi:hypothetical protein
MEEHFTLLTLMIMAIPVEVIMAIHMGIVVSIKL